MGIFGKIKGFFGFTGVKIEFTKTENPFPFTDSVYKANYEVKAGNDVTIKEVKHILIAKRSITNDGSTSWLEYEFASESSDDYDDIDVSFPLAVKAGETFEYGMCLTDVNIAEALVDWEVHDKESAKALGIKFFVKVEVDIVETAFAFDPSAEVEFEIE